MIAKNQVTRLTFTANLSTFGITFPTFENDSINVYVIEDSTGVETALTLSTHYTLSNIGVKGQDGEIDLVAGSFDWLDGSGNLDPLYSLVVEHDSRAFQPSFFRNLGANTAITLEQVLDRLTMAIKSVYRDLVDAQGDLISQANAIALNAADILLNTSAISTLTNRLDSADEEILSKKQTVNNGNVSSLLGTDLDETEFDSGILTYIAKRGARRQVGRVAIINDSPFKSYELERVGSAGLTWSATDVAGVGQIRLSADSSGDNTVIRYKFDRFSL